MKVPDRSRMMAHALGRGIEHGLSTAGASKYVRHSYARVRPPLRIVSSTRRQAARFWS
jgi:hypothetical protein